MKRLSCAAPLLAAALLAAVAGPPAGDTTSTARIQVVDVGLGNAAFVVAPGDEVMLLDTGPARVDGSFTVTNSRNGYAKNYPAK